MSSLCWGALVLVFGCEEPASKRQEIEAARVIGVQVETLSGGAAVISGEAFSVDALLVDEEGPFEGNVAVQICLATPSDRGVPVCAQEPFFEGELRAEDFPIEATAPEGLGEADRLVLLGVACADSQPVLLDSPLDWSCSGGEEPARFSYEIAVSRDDELNLNPDLGAAQIEVEGVSVAPEDHRLAPSCGDEALELELGKTHDFEFTLTGALESGEGLQVSHFSTDGTYERAFSFPDAEALSIEWEAGKSAGPVKHYLVVRDGLGGVSWVSWSVCQR